MDRRYIWAVLAMLCVSMASAASVYLTDTPTVNLNESDPIFVSENGTIARTGACAPGQFVVNTTTGGVQCATPPDTLYFAGTGLTLSANTFALNTTYTNGLYDVLGAAAAVNTTANIQRLGFNTTSQLNTLYDALGAAAARAGVGTCPAGSYVQNTTTGGVQCVADNDLTQVQRVASLNNGIGVVQNASDVNLTLNMTYVILNAQSLNDTTLANQKALPGTCAAGTVVQNTTTSGVQCVATASASGIQTIASPNMSIIVAQNTSLANITVNMSYVIANAQVLNDSAVISSEITNRINNDSDIRTSIDNNRTFLLNVDGGLNATKAAAGTCPAGQVMQNATNTTVQCVVVTATGDGTGGWINTSTSTAFKDFNISNGTRGTDVHWAVGNLTFTDGSDTLLTLLQSDTVFVHYNMTIGGTVDIGGHIVGNHGFDIVQNNPASANIAIQNNATNGFSGVDLYRSDGVLMGGYGYGNAGTGSAYAGYYYIDGTSAPIAFNTGGAASPRGVVTLAGLWGFGTTAPVTLVDINGTATIRGALDMNSHQIDNVLDPTAAQDAATKAYVDRLGEGIEQINMTVVLQSTTSNTVYSTMSNLTLSLANASTYMVKCEIIQDAAAVTTGVQLQINTTGTPALVRTTYTKMATASAMETFSGTSASSNSFAATGSSTTPSIALVSAIVRTAASSSVWTVGMRSEVSGSAANIESGSYCMAVRAIG